MLANELAKGLNEGGTYVSIIPVRTGKAKPPMKNYSQRSIPKTMKFLVNMVNIPHHPPKQTKVAIYKDLG